MKKDVSGGQDTGIYSSGMNGKKKRKLCSESPNFESYQFSMTLEYTCTC